MTHEKFDGAMAFHGHKYQAMQLFTELSPGNIRERFAAEIQPTIRKACDEE